MRFEISLAAIAAATTVAAAGVTGPVVIDFESYNGGATTPTDDELIIDQYNTAEYLFTTFSSFPVNGTTEAPAFEQVGNQGTGIEGFVNDRDGNFDTLVAGGGDIGQFFLRGRGENVTDVSPFTFQIDFGGAEVPTFVSFDLLDLDGTNANNSERWDVYVTDRLGNRTLAFQTPEGINNMIPFDAEAFGIALDDADGIVRIELEFSGTKDNGIGVGLDNFRLDGIVPTPASAALMGLAGLVATRRRR